MMNVAFVVKTADYYVVQSYAFPVKKINTKYMIVMIIRSGILSKHLTNLPNRSMRFIR